MANTNTQGFGLIPAGQLGGTPATQGQGKYKIDAGYATALYQGSAVRLDNPGGANTNPGYIITAQAAITNDTIGVLNGVFYNAATTLKPTWQNYYNQVTPANSEDITAFVIDSPFQLFVGAADAAVTQANIGRSVGLTVTAAGSTTSGQSSSTLTIGTIANTANQWRLLRVAEDPSNEDITAAYASYVVVAQQSEWFGEGTAGQ